MAATTTPETQKWSEPSWPTDRKLLSDLLSELFPLGLTDDAPIRKAKANA